MKSNNTTSDNSQKQELYLKELNTIKDKRYGNVTLFIDPNSEMYFTRKEKVFKSKSQLNEVVAQINKRINTPNLYYVGPLTYEYDEIFIKEKSQNAPILKLFYPFPEENLEEELGERIKEKKAFNNQEITYLMYDLILGFYHLQHLGFSHCKFGPEFVAKTTTGYAILDDPLHYPYDVIDLKKRKDWYLSPEAYKAALLNKKAGREYKLVKSDVFSLGLVLLEASTQMNIDEIYSHPGEMELDIDALNHLMEILKVRYPENNLLVSTLRKMLTFDENERPDFFEMFERMPPYELIKNYFENNPMTHEERQSMRNSIHGSHAIEAKDPKIFGKSRPDDTKFLKYSSIKNSRYIENIDKESKGFDNTHEKVYKPGFEIMIKSEVVEKEVINRKISVVNEEDMSLYKKSDGDKEKSVVSSFSNLKPKISVKIQDKPKIPQLKKPPTPVKNLQRKNSRNKRNFSNENLLKNKYLCDSENESNFNTGNNLKEEEPCPKLKEDSKNEYNLNGIDINALVQQKIKEELEKFTIMRMKEEELRKEREIEDQKLREELKREREEFKRQRLEGEKEKEELRREKEEIEKMKMELIKQQEILEQKSKEILLKEENETKPHGPSLNIQSKQQQESKEVSTEKTSPENHYEPQNQVQFRQLIQTSPFRNQQTDQNNFMKRINVSPKDSEEKPKLIPVLEENLDLPEVK